MPLYELAALGAATSALPFNSSAGSTIGGGGASGTAGTNGKAAGGWVSGGGGGAAVCANTQAAVNARPAKAATQIGVVFMAPSILQLLQRIKYLRHW